MRAYVLPDARLAKLAGRFVRLDIDTENPRNAAFVERFPIEAWPTLLVVDPATEQPVVRWAGTATVAQIEALALDGERAIRAGQASRADAALARADRERAGQRYPAAAAAYREAIAAGGPRWSGRERAAEALVQSVAFAGDAAACAAAVREVLPLLPDGPTRARAVAEGLSCVVDLEDAAVRGRELAALEPDARRALGVPGLLADDRSALYDVLSYARELAGDEAGAKALARRWLAFLEGEAGRARTPLERSAFDGQRLSAALRLGDPERVLPALLRSDRELPGEYVPATNLAVLYLELGRPRDALAAADRALARAQGPRRVRVLLLRAEAQEKLGDRPAARASLEQALRIGDEVPENVRPTRQLDKARRLLAELQRS
jgi:tetratricopeptide (TPR) repeat protein